jgi:hypothetical protein
VKKDDDKPAKATPRPAGGERPEIYAVKRGREGVTLSRRSFLGAVTAAAGALTLGAPGCSDGSTPPISTLPNLMSPSADCGLTPAHSGRIDGLLTIDDKLISWDYKTTKAWSWTGGTLIKSVRFAEVIDAPEPFPPLFAHLNSENRLNRHSVLAADGKTLASYTNNNVNIWSSKDGGPRLVQTLPDPKGQIERFCFSADGETLLLGKNKGRFELWRMGASEPLRRYRDRDYDPDTPFAISPDGEFLLYGANPASLRLMSLSDGKVVKTIKFDETSSVSSIALTPHGPLAAICLGINVLFLRLPEGDLTGGITNYKALYRCVAISSDGRRLAAGAYDGAIFLWEIQSAKMLGCLYDPELTAEGTEVSQSRLMDAEALTSSCETSLPDGATCLCDCVGESRSYEPANPICSCDIVSAPAGHGGATIGCVCDTIGVGSKPPPCNCVGYVSTGGGGHYWHPN